MNISNYATLTEYLTPDDKALLAKGMDTTPSMSEILTRQLKTGEWETLIPHCDRTTFPLQTLKLLKEEQISAMQWSTSQLFFNVYPHHDPKTVRFIPLFPNGQQGLLATNMINATMKIAFSALIAYRKSLGDQLHENLSIPVDQGHKHWNEKQEKQFYARLWKHYPASEHFFMLVHNSDPAESPTVGHLISLKLGFNMLSSLNVGKKPVRMIPSRGMVQALIEATTVDAPLPLYRLGLSPNEGLHEALRLNGRDLYQSFDPVKHLSADTVDKHIANPAYAEAELHDFYHQLMLGHVPPAHRKVFTDFGDAVRAYLETEKNPFPPASEFFGLIVDMEHTFYYIDDKPKEFHEILKKKHIKDQFCPEIVFWLSIGNSYTRALKRCQLPYTTLDPSFNQSLARWTIQHHEELNSHCKPIADMLISDEKMPKVDRKFNLYYELRHVIKIQLRDRLIEMIQEDCEELTKLKDYFSKAPDTFVKTYLFRLAAPFLPQ